MKQYAMQFVYVISMIICSIVVFKCPGLHDHVGGAEDLAELRVELPPPCILIHYIHTHIYIYLR